VAPSALYTWPVDTAELRQRLEAAGLDRDDLAADPIEQWHRWHDLARQAGCVEPEAMVVATVGDDGEPDARYVLVRTVDQRGFWFLTNLASTKGRELAAHPAAALVFGWLELHRQVRVRGSVEVVAPAEVEDYFVTRPRAARLASWASRQSSVLPDRAALEAAVVEADARFPGDDVPMPPWVGGFRVVPDEIEFWQGRPGRLHDRFRYTRGAARWSIDRLSP
jgi:pyridoxamine 5'-phosphate oxidase